MERHLAGDRAATNALIEDLEPMMLRAARAVLRDWPAAEDVYIESMVAVLERLPEIDPMTILRYAKLTARRRAVDMLRSRQFRDSRKALWDTARFGSERPGPVAQQVELSVPSPDPDPESQTAEREGDALIRRIIDDMKPAMRDVVRMYYDDGLSYDGICERLDRSRTWVARQLGLARLVVAKALKEGSSDAG